MVTRLENKDCMEVMREYPDNYFQLSVVDPPYGINNPNHEKPTAKLYKGKNWNKDIPHINYFNELFRISQSQIIWGGNYYTKFLEPVNSWIIWDKLIHGNPNGFSKVEMAWSNLLINAELIKIRVNQVNKIHPTQKPIKLYEWIYNNYAKKEFKVIDTHLGSGSNLIAADKFGIAEFVGCELDTDYFDSMMKRWELYKSQTKLF